MLDEPAELLEGGGEGDIPLDQKTRLPQSLYGSHHHFGDEIGVETLEMAITHTLLNQRAQSIGTAALMLVEQARGVRVGFDIFRIFGAHVLRPRYSGREVRANALGHAGLFGRRMPSVFPHLAQATPQHQQHEFLFAGRQFVNGPFGTFQARRKIRNAQISKAFGRKNSIERREPSCSAIIALLSPLLLFQARDTLGC